MSQLIFRRISLIYPFRMILLRLVRKRIRESSCILICVTNSPCSKWSLKTIFRKNLPSRVCIKQIPVSSTLTIIPRRSSARIARIGELCPQIAAYFLYSFELSSWSIITESFSPLHFQIEILRSFDAHTSRFRFEQQSTEVTVFYFSGVKTRRTNEE